MGSYPHLLPNAHGHYQIVRDTCTSRCLVSPVPHMCSRHDEFSMGNRDQCIPKTTIAPDTPVEFSAHRTQLVRLHLRRGNQAGGALFAGLLYNPTGE